ncbi:MAG: hypothetical protein OXI79_01935 [Gammaproteobacteria bacterium]|nr:hypothetical protein [Gammaproteobacteria bacterium]
MMQTLAVATAEFRSLRRAVQTWVVVAVAVAGGLAPFLYYSAAHGIRSGYGPTAGSVSPRFLIHGFGDLTLLAMMAGVVLLAGDALARDRRDSIAAAVASRPPSNLSLVAGQAAALALAAWLAPAVLVLATLALGTVARTTGFWTGDFVEPWSLAAFLLLDAPVALAAWTALVVFLRVAFGSAWAAAATAFALLALQTWALFALPAWLLPVVSLVPRFATISSDVLPEFADLDVVAQRFALLLLGGGALCLAAAALARRTRRDDGAARQAAAGAVLGSLGAAFLALMCVQAAHERTERAGWIAAHHERRGAADFDIERMAVQVAIDPGRQLRLDATLRVRGEAQKDALAFRFNPGMEITHVRADGETLEHRHESGLLDVRLAGPLAEGDTLELSLLATGVPHPGFAYLDEALDPSSLALADSLLHTLGTEALIFESDYAALLPGVAWLPAAGSAFGARPDFFDLSLEVDLPPGWLAAGPGRRTESPAPSGGSRFGFRPPAPVAEVALLASDRFERRAVSVAGVDVELLLHREHMRNARFFRDAAKPIRDNFEWRFAFDSAIPYPYGGLSLVEVPARLRGFGGGQRMDSALAAPGIAMVREHGFPTARFDFASRTPDYAAAREQGDQAFAETALIPILFNYLDSDYSGGDPYAALARSHLLFRTRARGPAGSPLDLLLEALANRLAGDPKSHFSAHVFVGAMPRGIGARLIGRTMADTAPVHNALVDLQFRVAARTAGDMSPAGSPVPVATDAASDGGYRRAAAMAELVDVGLGKEKTGALLADLLRRFDGRTFAMGDLLAAVRRLDAPLAETLSGQLRSQALPGFVHSPLEVVRIADGERGLPRYLSRLQVRNAEHTPGVVRLVLWVMGEPMFIGHLSDLIHLAGDEAVEIELTTPSPPLLARLHTFLSRNRGQVALGTPAPDSIPQTDDEPSGTRRSAWHPPGLPGLVVDDLDVGFAVRPVGRPDSVFGAAQTDAAADGAESLAEAWWNVPAGRWGRQPVARGWGKYGATVVVAAQGDGTEEAVFAAKLPAAGRWRLHYHVPSDRAAGVDHTYGRLRWAGLRQLTAFETGFRLEKTGTYRMRLMAGTDEFDIAFDAGKAGYGWHVLGDFDLKAGVAELAVSSRSDAGDYVVADAVWWEPRRAEHATTKRDKG